LRYSSILSNDYDRDVLTPYSFNRKEKKDHAEGGIIVDYPLNGKIVIVDDEITAGTAINESIQIIKQHNAQITGVLVAVDRAEVTPNGSGKSAIQAVAEKNNIQVGAIITIDCIMEFMEEIGSFKDELEFMREYKAQYGIKKD
jgi:orotate phosphoribosyltransferase